MTDFRALCARMADELDYYRQLLMDNRRETHALAVEARAALAESDGPAVQSREPTSVVEQPSDEELLELMPQQMRDDLAFMTRKTVEHGAPAGLYRVTMNTHIADLCRAVLARWGNHPAQPIPVSERLPEAGDCDAEGRCWWFDEHIFNLADACAVYKQGGTWEFTERDLLGFVQRVIEEHEKYRDHGLTSPAHALPLPSREVE